MNKPSFSVLISVYKNDSAVFFEIALKSISINQTLKPKQVVVVEDGPVGEGIESAIRSVSYLSPAIDWTIVRKEKNAGLAAALNSGLKECKYNYVARMDSDDISTPDRFEKQMNYIAEHPEITVLGGAIAEFKETVGDIMSERHVGLVQEDIVKMSKKRTPFNHVSVVYKRDDVISVGSYSEDFGKLEDYKLWVDLLAAGCKVANLDDILVHVRVGNGFIERRSSKREIHDWDNLQKYLLGSGIVTKKEALINRIYIRAFIYMPVWAKKLAYKYILRK